MKKPRNGLSCIRIKDEIIVVGGFDGENYLKTSEIFNFQNGNRTRGPDFPIGVCCGQLVKAREGMRYSAYYIGGQTGGQDKWSPTYLSSVYGLTKDLSRFEKLGDLKHPRSHHVALKLPINIIDKF